MELSSHRIIDKCGHRRLWNLPVGHFKWQYFKKKKLLKKKKREREREILAGGHGSAGCLKIFKVTEPTYQCHEDDDERYCFYELPLVFL